jgi:type IV secretion system protein VirB4
MVLAAQTKQEDKEVLLDTPNPDFIPYACHYNQDTILTKNGELLQTIEVQGFSSANVSHDIQDIRAQIRESIVKTIKSKHFSVYFHTIRHAVNLDDAPKFPNYFSQKLHETWVGTNAWNKKHVNNLYVTIIRSGMALNFSTFLKKPFINSITKLHDEALVEAHKELDAVTSELLKDLEAYSPVKLGMIKDPEKGYCSALLKFFSKIIQIKELDFPLDMMDLSQSLSVSRIAFGYNALQISHSTGKFLATIFSIKENNEVDTASLEKFLQLPQRMIVTQAISFISNKKGYSSSRYQNHVLEVSGDSEFKKQSGLAELDAIDKDSTNIFCASQTTVMVVSEDLDQLKQDSLRLYKTLSDLGLPAVKEDLNLEHCFWSQLPANFAYLVRQTISPSKKLGNFALLNNLPFGELKSKWGNFVTIFETVLSTPYFFNFHVENAGHTLIAGDDDITKSVTLNFLLSEALKFNTKFIYLDSHKRSELYMKALGVDYKVFNFDKNLNQLTMNPLLLKDTPSNRTFLNYWFIFLLNKYTDLATTKIYLPVIAKAIEVLYTLPVEKRKLSNVSEFFVDTATDKINKEILGKLQKWIGEESLAHIFDNSSDCLADAAGASLAIDISDIFDTSMDFNLPVLTHLLHFFKENYTGEACSALCVASGSRVFNSMYFEKNLEYILDDLMNRNAIVLGYASFFSEKVNWSERIAKIFNKKFKTQIFLADNAPSYHNIVKLFNFSQEEQMYLQSLNIETKQFLLRHNGISIVLKLDLTSCEKELAILSGDHKYAEAAKRLMKTKGSKPEAWLPALYEETLD